MTGGFQSGITFSLDIFWVSLYALFWVFFFLITICLFVFALYEKPTQYIGSKWVLQHLCVGLLSVFLHCLRRIEASTIHCLLFLLFATESLLYYFIYHTNHTLLSSLFSHAYVRRSDLVFEINWKANRSLGHTILAIKNYWNHAVR